MGLFHKSLEDAKKAIKKGEKAKAERILNEHLNNLPDLIKDIENLKRLLEDYRSGLQFIQNFVRNIDIHGSASEKASKVIKMNLEKMTAIEHISDIISKNVKKER